MFGEPPNVGAKPTLTIADGAVFSPISIKVNGTTVVQGVNDGSDVYVPFSFLAPHYELYGSSTASGFQYSDSNAVIRRQGTYNPIGNYLNFDKQAFESKDGITMDAQGIPLCNFRWGDYYYAITVANYALERYSQGVVNSTGTFGRIHENAEDGATSRWTISDAVPAGASLANVTDSTIASKTIAFAGSGIDNSFSLPLASTNGNLLAWDMKLTGSYRVYVELDTSVGKRYLTYYPGSGAPYVSGQYIYIALPLELDQGWSNVVRSLARDLKLGEPTASVVRAKTLIVRGSGRIDNVRTLDPTKFGTFLNVADWLVAHQDSTGGWPAGWDHMFFAGRTAVMPAGWYSALGQGLGISTMIRAYHLTQSQIYLDTARRALPLYDVPVNEHGIRSMWDGGYPFFQEYPTTPGSFVLNGFMFALLGLYDAIWDDPTARASTNYHDGIGTLKKVLPLYDTGSRSAYDLTHYTAGGGYPNIARWGYHATHISELTALNTVENDAFLRATTARWIGYTTHNVVPPN